MALSNSSYQRYIHSKLQNPDYTYNQYQNGNTFHNPPNVIPAQPHSTAHNPYPSPGNYSHGYSNTNPQTVPYFSAITEEPSQVLDGSDSEDDSQSNEDSQYRDSRGFAYYDQKFNTGGPRSRGWRNMNKEVRDTLPDITTMTKHVENMVYYGDSDSDSDCERGCRLKNQKYGGYFYDNCHFHKGGRGSGDNLDIMGKQLGVTKTIDQMTSEIERKVWTRKLQDRSRSGSVDRSKGNRKESNKERVVHDSKLSTDKKNLEHHKGNTDKGKEVKFEEDEMKETKGKEVPQEAGRKIQISTKDGYQIFDKSNLEYPAYDPENKWLLDKNRSRVSRVVAPTTQLYTNRGVVLPSTGCVNYGVRRDDYGAQHRLHPGERYYSYETSKLLADYSRPDNYGYRRYQYAPTW